MADELSSTHMFEPISVRAALGVGAAAIYCACLAVTMASAQEPRRAPLPDMQVIAESLGVQCEYCHGPRQVTAIGKPRLEVAREMIEMTAELNTRIRTATGKPATEAVRVECSTCHLGVPVPKPLRDLILETSVRQSPEEAA